MKDPIGTVKKVSRNQPSDLKLSRASKELLVVLGTLKNPVTWEELWRTPHLHLRHRATIYKLLMQFEKSGLVRRLHLQGQPYRFELVRTQGIPSYIQCNQCHQLREVFQTDPKKWQAACGLQTHGWKIVRHELKFYGICPRCQGRNKG